MAYNQVFQSIVKPEPFEVESDLKPDVRVGSHGVFYNFFILPYEEYFLDRRVLWQSQVPDVVFWIWRVLAFGGLTGIVVSQWYFSMQRNTVKSICYLTNWTMFLTWYDVLYK